MSKETLPFIYKDGPLLGYDSVTLRCKPEEIGAEPTLHRVRMKPRGREDYATAQGLYAFTKDQGDKVWAVHVPSEADLSFSDPAPTPPEAPEPAPKVEAPPKKKRRIIVSKDRTAHFAPES